MSPECGFGQGCFFVLDAGRLPTWLPSEPQEELPFRPESTVGAGTAHSSRQSTRQVPVLPPPNPQAAPFLSEAPAMMVSQRLGPDTSNGRAPRQDYAWRWALNLRQLFLQLVQALPQLPDETQHLAFCMRRGSSSPPPSGNLSVPPEACTATPESPPGTFLGRYG